MLMIQRYTVNVYICKRSYSVTNNIYISGLLTYIATAYFRLFQLALQPFCNNSHICSFINYEKVCILHVAMGIVCIVTMVRMHICVFLDAAANVLSLNACHSILGQTYLTDQVHTHVHTYVCSHIVTV